MKPFFSLIKQPHTSPYKKYITNTLNDEQQTKLDEIATKLDKLDKKKSGYSLLKILGLVLAVLPSLGFLVRVTANEDLWSSGLPLSIALLIAIVLGITLFVLSIVFTIKLENSDASKQLEQEYEDTYLSICKEIGATGNIVDIDIFFPEVNVDDSGNHELANLMFHTCLNLPAKVYLDASNESIGIIYANEVVNIPKASFYKIEKVDKCINFGQWNKIEKINSDTYSEYHILTNTTYGYCIKGYYKVMFKFDNEDYFIIVPLYDGDRIASVLNLPIE